MSDQAHDYAERKIAEFQAEVWEVYQQAQADAQEALAKFLKRFEKEDAKRRELVEKGEMTKAEYKSWRSGQILRSRQLSSTLDQVSQAMTEANQVAMAALAGKLPEVYAENANYSAFWMCKETGLAVSFDLVDPDTVQHMLTAGEALFVAPGVNVAKDKLWNRKLMASQLTQGVLLGESIPKMARRVQRVTGSNYATAVRTARTAVTGAENAGRVHSYKRAKDMGIKLQKEWLATLDGRTRHSHRQLDGQKIPNEEGAKFDNGCRYPGDPQGRYDEICNCRCTLVAAIEGVDTSDAERWSRLPEGMTYEEWKAGYHERPPYDSSGRTMGEFFAQPSVKAQLEKRGMTEAQARKALSEHFKAQGTSGNAFGAMQKAEQQREWAEALRDRNTKNLGGKMPVGLSGGAGMRKVARGMSETLDNCPSEDMRALFSKYGFKLKAVGHSGGRSYHSSAEGQVHLNVRTALSGSELYEPYGLAFHEFGHMVDWLAGDGAMYASAKSGIVKAIDADWAKYKARVADRLVSARLANLSTRDLCKEMRRMGNELADPAMKEAAQKARHRIIHDEASFAEIMEDRAFGEAFDRFYEAAKAGRWDVSKEEIERGVWERVRAEAEGKSLSQIGSLSDVLQGASGECAPLGAGHEPDYFKCEDWREKRATEFFAEMCDALATNPKSYAELSRMFPTAVKEFEELIGRLAK